MLVVSLAFLVAAAGFASRASEFHVPVCYPEFLLREYRIRVRAL